MRCRKPTPKRGLSYSGRPGNMLELFKSWRQRGFATSFSEFLDEFKQSPDPAALQEEPPHGIPQEYRAFLAATCEMLAVSAGFPVPEWCNRPNAVLPEPVCWDLFRSSTLCHPDDRETYSAKVAMDTPAPFKRRGILVRASVLSRI